MVTVYTPLHPHTLHRTLAHLCCRAEREFDEGRVAPRVAAIVVGGCRELLPVDGRDDLAGQRRQRAALRLRGRGAAVVNACLWE